MKEVSRKLKTDGLKPRGIEGRAAAISLASLLSVATLSMLAPLKTMDLVYGLEKLLKFQQFEKTI